MADFQPVNDDHAIERVTFVVRFARPFTSEEIGQFRRNHSLWAGDLPASRENAGLALTIDGDGPRVEPLPGIEFAFSRPDGTAVWALRIVGPDVAVECTRYTRWIKVWSAAQLHLSKALVLLQTLPDPPQSEKVFLNVVDAFASTDPDASAATVFKPGSLLPPGVPNFGSSWHCHTGWFDGTGDDRILHNLNVDAAAQQGDEPSARISVFHGLSVDTKSLALADLNAFVLERMETLHQANKNVMTSLLTDKIAERIKLGAHP